MHIAVKALAAAGMLLVVSSSSGVAQATLSGTLSLEERAGAERGDLRTAVVYLEPRERAIQVNDVPSMRSRVVAMHGREFRPHVSIVLAGGSVAFPNEDPFSHNVFSNVDFGPFDLGLYRRGATRTATFARPGVYPIYCNIHSMMVSYVVAVPTPWATQPDDAGHFTLRGVPAGRYVIHAWHEHGAREVTREITVGESGTDAMNLVIDARTYVDGPHLNKFGRPYALIRDDRY
jgi:plastocyanin